MTATRTATWENIGTKLENANNIHEVLKQSGLDYRVHKEELTTESGLIVPDYVATVKDNGDMCGVVGKKYEICQNEDAFDFVNYIDGDVKFLKAGETQTGMIYIIGVLPTVNILGDDFTPHLIFQNGHNGRYSVKTAIVPLRIVCQNQFNFAFKEAKNTITIKHNSLLEEKLVNAREVMKDTAEYMKTLREKAELYAGLKLTPEMLNMVIKNFFPVKDDMTDRQKNTVLAQRVQFENAYNAEDNLNFRGCGWGVFNAYSDYLTHREIKATKNANENHFMAVTFNPDFAKFMELVNSVAVA
jgi:phage/plasmid-like protein (TIGR03299 family)